MRSRRRQSRSAKRRICFVTGTRAEFGLMKSVLRAIADHPRLSLQIVATGMHLSRAHGRTVNAIRRDGWKVDATVPWRDSSTPALRAQATGEAMAGLARAFDRLDPDVVLVVGDRVEPFAAAGAAHLAGRIVAHVHGGDRALGQVDDTLRHAITKLAHLHFAATPDSANRIARLGEDVWRIHMVGSPGIDGITREAAESSGETAGEFALLVLHPADADAAVEYRRARLVASSAGSVFERVVIVYPNNDPGAQGIARRWEELRGDPRFVLHRNLPRARFLATMRDAAVLVGNSSSGIIEAASFGTPVVDIGPRQAGRQCSGNVIHAPYQRGAIEQALRSLWCDGRGRRFRGRNVYGGDGTGEAIARILAGLELGADFGRKLIAF